MNSILPINNRFKQSFDGYHNQFNNYNRSTQRLLNDNRYLNYLLKIYNIITSKNQYILIIQVLFLFYLLSHTLDKFQRTDDSDATLIQYRNNYCSKATLDHHLYRNAFDDHLQQYNLDKSVLCNSKKHQFKKFVWIFVDSLAHDQAYPIISQFEENANTFRILNHGFKFSTAIYTSFFTGKIPTNYAGKPIHSDNIFYQMKNAGMKMHFVGPEFPAPALLDDSPHYKRYFDQFTIIPQEPVLISPLFGENPSLHPSKESVKLALDELTGNGKKSVMLTTNLLDDKIHRKGKYDPPTLALLSQLTNNVPLVKQWLSENPEYVFIMNSDHGGSKTGGTHEGELHGLKDGGNEGFMFFYHPTAITPQSSTHREWLDTVDIAPTISTYFKDVNIPLESLGMVSTYFEDNANQTSTYVNLVLNAIQIRQLCRLKGFPYSESDFEKATNDFKDLIQNQNSQLENKIEQLKRFIISIKEPMVDFKKFPATYLLIMGIIAISHQIFSVKMETNLISMLKQNIVSTVFPFFFLYIDFLFLKFDYHKHFTNIFYLYIIIISTTILYLIYQLIINIENCNINNSNSSNSNSKNENNESNNSNSNNNNDFREIDISIDSNNTDTSLNNNNQNQNQNQNQNNNNNNQKSLLSDWFSLTFCVVVFVITNFGVSQFFMEFLPLYEMFQSISFLINYILLGYLLYLNTMSKILSTITNSSSMFDNIITLSKNYQILLHSNTQRKLFLYHGGVYFLVYFLSFLYEMSDNSAFIMQVGYFFMGVQVLITIVLGNFAQDIYIISSLMLYIVSTDNQRFYLLVILLPQLYLLSNIYNNANSQKYSHQTNMWDSNYRLKSLARMIPLLMIFITFQAYVFMDGQFNMNVDVRAGNIGLVNMEDYPTFSGFLMAYHKLGYFFVLITFLTRLTNTRYQQIQSYLNIGTDIESISYEVELKFYLLRLLSQKALIMMWIFNYNFWQYKDYLDCFIMTLIFSIIAVGYGFCLVLEEFSKYMNIYIKNKFHF
ncbi:hypothetical protein CYY_005589 [Polysphondylium violaceum]|uniref:Uncharacterized protein n=1 Tax=Polysphondylium violaceum TaxID=133409 RepID=A0A8J4V6Q2_9MYCE|nr:hypothetical protein CYY_005589 [Polysphondylium violaceum]